MALVCLALKAKALRTKALAWQVLFGIGIVAVGGKVALAQNATLQPPAATVPKEEPVEKPDYALLLRALKRLKENAEFGYTARSTVEGSGAGFTLLGNQKLELVALQNGKLHADVSLWLGDAADNARKYTVVSDGSKLYTWRAEVNRYSVKSLDASKLSDETARIGLLGTLYYNRDLTGMVDQVTPENVGQVFEQLQGIGLKFSGSRIGETPIFTLKIEAPAVGKAEAAKASGDTDEKATSPQSLTMRFFVDPETAQFRQLEIRGQDRATRFALTEKIVRQTNRPVYEAPAFRFVPTAKDTKVTDVPVDLVKE